MARRISNTVMITSILVVFSGTLWGMLNVLEPESAAPCSHTAEISPLPVVAAPPPAEAQPIALEDSLLRIEQRLEELGVGCHSGECFPDF